MDKGGSLSIALKANRKMKHRTSFLGGIKSGDSKQEAGGLVHKSISLSHVVFRACDSKSNFSNLSNSGNAATGKRNQRQTSGSLFRKVAGQ